jgi:hypothetical protein
MNAAAVKKALSEAFRKNRDFGGISVKQNQSQEYVVVKLLKSDSSLRTQIPAQMEGIKIMVEVTKPTIAY